MPNFENQSVFCEDNIENSRTNHFLAHPVVAQQTRSLLLRALAHAQ